MEFYDLILGSIPAAIIATTGILSVFGIAVMTSIAIGAALSMGIILYALFVRAPLPTSEAHDEPPKAAYPSAD